MNEVNGSSKDIENYLKSRDINIITPSTFYTYIREWLEFYSGNVEGFHNYRFYNGVSYISAKRYSLGMAQKVAQDHASLLLNEKVKITTDFDSFQQLLDNVLKKNNFRVRANQLVELAYSLGTGAFVEFLDANKITNIDYVNALSIYPITVVNGDIVECAFASEISSDKNGKTYYINIHRLDENGNYIIENKKILADSNKLIQEIPSMDLADTVVTNSPIPRFQIIKPNIVNNIDLNSAMGISIFANSIDELKAIDIVFDSYINEFKLGRKRVYVPISMVKAITDEAGITKPTFDSNDQMFYAVSEDAADKLTESNGELRFGAHEAALQKFLNLLSTKCGLGNDYYSFENGTAKTATEVISEKSDLYSNLKKNELILESAIIGMVEAIADMNGYGADKINTTVAFDDSIITDTEADANRAMLEFNSGIIDAVEYYKRAYKMSDDAAIKLRDEIAARKTPTANPEESLFTDGDVE